MRYKLDAGGYVCSVAFNAYLDNCIEYTGLVPSGYKTLDEWASNALIQAYYIEKGNLVIDYARKTEIENRAEQEAIANAPVLRKDIFDTEEALAGQYVRQIASGNVIVLEDIKTVAPKLKITGIKPGYSKLSIHTNGKNMLPCNAVSNVISGVTFTKNASGSMTVLGTATENIDYVIADGKDTTIFALKSNCDYFLNLGGLNCELKYYDGETTAQQYIGASGLINLPEHIEVTQVIIKIASGDSVNTTFYPQLEVGNAFTKYETHKLRTLDIEFPEKNKPIIPSDTLYAEDTLYPGMREETIEYILIENGTIIAYVGGKRIVVSNGGVGLFNCSTVYATKDVELEIEYSANFLLVDSLAFLQGKATTTNRFKILDDGSIEANNGYFSGKIEATSGSFSGSISASYISGGKISGTSISGGTISGTFISGNTISGGTISGGAISGGTISGSSISGSTISGTTISGGSISGATISGGTISGGTIDGGSISIGTSFSVDSFGVIKASKGQIAGFTIGSSSICYGKTSLSSLLAGVYIGTDGISVGAGDVFKVTSNGSITIKADIKSDVFSTLQIGGSTGVYADYTGVKVGDSTYSKLENTQLKFSDSGNIYVGSTNVMSINSSKVGISTSVMVGGSGYSTKVVFFGNSGTVKKTVTNLTSTTSASTVGTKLNDLLGVLRGYGLIG